MGRGLRGTPRRRFRVRGLAARGANPVPRTRSHGPARRSLPSRRRFLRLLDRRLRSDGVAGCSARLVGSHDRAPPHVGSRVGCRRNPFGRDRLPWRRAMHAPGARWRGGRAELLDRRRIGSPRKPSGILLRRNLSPHSRGSRGVPAAAAQSSGRACDERRLRQRRDRGTCKTLCDPIGPQTPHRHRRIARNGRRLVGSTPLGGNLPPRDAPSRRSLLGGRRKHL